MGIFLFILEIKHYLRNFVEEYWRQVNRTKSDANTLQKISGEKK